MWQVPGITVVQYTLRIDGIQLIFLHTRAINDQRLQNVDNNAHKQRTLMKYLPVDKSINDNKSSDNVRQRILIFPYNRFRSRNHIFG